jgi:hypothetical protein
MVGRDDLEVAIWFPGGLQPYQTAPKYCYTPLQKGYIRLTVETSDFTKRAGMFSKSKTWAGQRHKPTVCV